MHGCAELLCLPMRALSICLQGAGSTGLGSLLRRANDRSAPNAKLWFTSSALVLLVLYYALCSSTMLVINKVAIYYVPAPSFILFCQLCMSAGFVFVFQALGYIDADGGLQWSKIRGFPLVVFAFLGTIFANMKVLQHANVETFITFRASTPIVLSLCDYLFLGRTLPRARSWACLILLLLGAIGYVTLEKSFHVDAYTWLGIWYFFFIFEAVYVKHMCETIKLSNWDRVLYTNLLSAIPLIFCLPALGEHVVLRQIKWNMHTIGPLLLSCMVGVGMSHSAYYLRDAVSATLFTITGILCKLLTVVINLAIWDHHAPPMAISFLLVW